MSDRNKYSGNEDIIKIRKVLSDNAELRRRLKKFKPRSIDQDKHMELVFTYLDGLIDKEETNHQPKRIAYNPDDLLWVLSNLHNNCHERKRKEKKNF